MSLHHPIAIIGAGLGGLTLARILHLSAVETAVYDVDATATARPQGGMLDIHEESGQMALHAAQLYDDFRRLIHVGGDGMRILDKHATILLDEAGGQGGPDERPEVSRRDLRDLLLSSLPDGTVRWGSKVTAVRTLENVQHEVVLADGTTFTTELLIGADGAWSRVQALLLDSVPVYSGISFVEARLKDADVCHPETARAVGKGLTFALSDQQGLIVHDEPDGQLETYIALKTPLDWLKALDFSDIGAIKAVLRERFADWDPRLLALITEANGALIPRPIHALPVGQSWGRVPGVTLLGDAAHLMSPFAGEGANLAMQDGAELALALLAHPHDTETALTVYEQALFPRSEVAAAASADNLKLSFGPGAPQGLLDLMARYAAQAPAGPPTAG